MKTLYVLNDCALTSTTTTLWCLTSRSSRFGWCSLAWTGSFGWWCARRREIPSPGTVAVRLRVSWRTSLDLCFVDT